VQENTKPPTSITAHFQALSHAATKALIKHSDLLCLDVDHLNSVQPLFNRLLQDNYFDTQLLFRSPSGDGLKWITSIDTKQATHGDFFATVVNYILQTCGVEVDKSGRDIPTSGRKKFRPFFYVYFFEIQLISWWCCKKYADITIWQSGKKAYFC
jgi:hypothetical protein